MRERNLSTWGIQTGVFAALLVHFVLAILKLCPLYTGSSILVTPWGPIMKMGKSHNSKTEWDGGVWVPGAFKLDCLLSFHPILLWQFSISLTFILGGQFLLPQRANVEKREISQLQNCMRQRGFCAWGVQTGRFVALIAYCVLEILSTLSLSWCSTFLITPFAVHFM